MHITIDMHIGPCVLCCKCRSVELDGLQCSALPESWFLAMLVTAAAGRMQAKASVPRGRVGGRQRLATSMRKYLQPTSSRCSQNLGWIYFSSLMPSGDTRAPSHDISFEHEHRLQLAGQAPGCQQEGCHASRVPRLHHNSPAADRVLLTLKVPTQHPSRVTVFDCSCAKVVIKSASTIEPLSWSISEGFVISFC